MTSGSRRGWLTAARERAPGRTVTRWPPHTCWRATSPGGTAMTEDRGEWTADTEGNLTPPGSDGDPLKPPTDEFGRDDPASLERERRRREREARRGKSRKAKKAPKAEQPR